jgi:thermitase
VGRVLRALGLCATLVLAACAPAWAQEGDAVPGALIVTFEEGASASEQAAAHRKVGATVVDEIGAIDAEVVKVKPGREEAALARYRSNPAVEVAERDEIVTTMSDDCPPPGSVTCDVPSDPDYPREWGLQNDGSTIQPDSSFDHDADIDAPYAWAITHGSSATRIGILDTGIDQNHVDLAGKLVGNVNFSSARSVEDRYGHGTHVGGTAAAITDNGIGVAGVGFNASLVNVKVLNDSGVGSCSAIANGITWAANNGVDVVNMSLGGGACSVEENAVNYAWGKGVLLAAAAGNSGAQTVSCPACYSNVIAVAATDNNDAKASFSNYGPGVDIAAPGVNVWSTFPNHKNRLGKRNYGYGNGTSMATPHVAGAAGLLWSSILDTNANGRRNDEVRARIESFADPIPGTGTLWSAGRLNVCRAVTQGGSTGPACASH